MSSRTYDKWRVLCKAALGKREGESKGQRGAPESDNMLHLTHFHVGKKHFPVDFSRTLQQKYTWILIILEHDTQSLMPDTECEFKTLEKN